MTSDKNTAPPVLSPLLTMTDSELEFATNDCPNRETSILWLSDELDAQRATVAAHEQETARLRAALTNIAAMAWLNNSLINIHDAATAALASPDAEKP